MADSRPLVSRSDEVMSGAVVFSGTRVPVRPLLLPLAPELRRILNSVQQGEVRRVGP